LYKQEDGSVKDTVILLLEVISRLFGHDNMRMTESYAHKRAEKSRQELERAQRNRKTVD
jgi:hypothetical protein